MSTDKKYLRGTRNINPAFTLHKIGQYAHKKAKETEVGKQLEIMTALLMCGLTLEALLNDVGYSIFVLKKREIELWNAIERLSPRKKLDVIAEKLCINIDFGSIPFQNFSQIFNYRDFIVHGKYCQIIKEVEVNKIEIDDLQNIDGFQEKWEKQTTIKNIEKWRKSVSDISEILTQKAELPNMLQIAGYQEWSIF